MVDLELREASAADADTLAAVYRSAYAENRELGFPAKAASATADEVREWIRDSRVLVAVADADAVSGADAVADADVDDDVVGDGNVVGGVRLEKTAPDRVKLSRLAVRDDLKGEGIGGRLLSHAERVASEAGNGTIWLTTPEAHPYLPDLYRDRGYVVTEPYPLPYRDYDEVVMEKELADDG